MRTRSPFDERGLTILGLVVIIAGLLVVVATATVGLGARRSVGDESAKRDARAAGVASAMHAAETGKVPTVEELAEYDPSREYEQLDAGEEVAVQGRVYVRTHGDVAELAARSGDTCFWVQRSPATTRYAMDACDADPAGLHFRDRW